MTAAGAEQPGRRVALVTGAANGIGHATAALLLRHGWTVGAFDVDERGLTNLVDVAARHASTVVTGHLDVTDPQDWERALQLLADDRLDLLVNNAGVLSSGPFVDTPLARHRAMVEVNVLGAVNGAHAAFPRLAGTPGATLVNLGSASAMYGQPDLATYSATKFAVRGLTEALELEWAAHGIRVLDLWPLFVETAMVAGMDAKAPRSLGVRLTADDVAGALLQVVEQGPTGGGRRAWWRTVHHPVGSQARVLAAAAQVAPHRLNRLLTRRIAGR